MDNGLRWVGESLSPDLALEGVSDPGAGAPRAQLQTLNKGGALREKWGGAKEGRCGFATPPLALTEKYGTLRRFRAGRHATPVRDAALSPPTPAKPIRACGPSPGFRLRPVLARRHDGSALDIIF